MSTRMPCGLIRVYLVPLAVALLIAATQAAVAQTTPLSPSPATQIPPPPQSAAPQPASVQPGAAPMLAAGYGLCQCISDRKRLDFLCPGSADACRSACGTHYSFKPDAQCHAAGNP
jgi:hypothetical protein